MIRGLYTAATGMLAEQFVQDSLAGNLANINTIGYKQDVPTFRALHEMALRKFESPRDATGTLIGMVGTGVAFEGSTPDNSAGPMLRTELKTDFALAGPGYFVVSTPQGDRYTRDGQFHLDAADPSGAYLANASGHRVLGNSGPINLKGSEDFRVTPDGRIEANGREIDRIRIVDFPAAAAQKQGGNLYSASTAPFPVKPSIRQGFLEQSNVNAVSAMVKMIAVQRAYEAAARAVTAQDETLGKAVNEVGRV